MEKYHYFLRNINNPQIPSLVFQEKGLINMCANFTNYPELNQEKDYLFEYPGWEKMDRNLVKYWLAYQIYDWYPEYRQYLYKVLEYIFHQEPNFNNGYRLLQMHSYSTVEAEFIIKKIDENLERIYGIRHNYDTIVLTELLTRKKYEEIFKILSEEQNRKINEFYESNECLDFIIYIRKNKRDKKKLVHLFIENRYYNNFNDLILICEKLNITFTELKLHNDYNMLTRIISNLDKECCIKIFDKIKVKINYNKSLKNKGPFSFDKPFLICYLDNDSDPERIEYIAKNTDPSLLVDCLNLLMTKDRIKVFFRLMEVHKDFFENLKK